MSFDILSARMYGTGSLGNVTDPAGQINSYAAVTATANQTITIDLEHASLGAYEQFTADTELLLHISGARTAQAAAANLGLYKFVKIMAANGNALTLNTAPLDISPTDYFYQAITVAQFKKLTLSTTISPLAFDEAKGYGGILVFKCSNKLVMKGSMEEMKIGAQKINETGMVLNEVSGRMKTSIKAIGNQIDQFKV